MLVSISLPTDSETTPSSPSFLITGDFNYNFSRIRLPTNNANNSSYPSSIDDHPLATLRCGTSSSTIDYLSDRHGPSLWKCNPNLASNKFFIKAFKDSIDKFYNQHMNLYGPDTIQSYFLRSPTPSPSLHPITLTLVYITNNSTTIRRP
ncbi:hypothetical protein BDF21DRAFT_490396 [Thamnidium elegans]|nr:hypothetical protein BDF21DRAFT_490396 [Thamnidium elegans]